MANRFTNRHPKIIAFTLQKGGTGKTGCAVNLAASLSTLKRSKGSRYKYKILVIDMDIHASASKNLDAYDEEAPGMYEVLTNKCNMEDIIVEKKYEFGRYGTCQIDIAPITIGAKDIENEWHEFENKEYLLKNALIRFKRLNEYDYVFIDCPPLSNCLLTNAYFASDYYIFPLTAEKESYDNIAITYKQIKALTNNLNKKTIIGSIINNYEITSTSKPILKELMGTESYKCFQTVIPHTKAYGETIITKTPVVFYHCNYRDLPKLFSAFRHLSKEFISRMELIK